MQVKICAKFIKKFVCKKEFIGCTCCWCSTSTSHLFLADFKLVWVVIYWISFLLIDISSVVGYFSHFCFRLFLLHLIFINSFLFFFSFFFTNFLVTDGILYKAHLYPDLQKKRTQALWKSEPYTKIYCMN